MDAIVAKQRDTHVRIANSWDNLRKLGAEKATVAALQTRLELLNSNWQKFETRHEEILELTDPAVQKHDYFKQDLFGVTEELYLCNRTRFLEHLSQLKQTEKSDPPSDPSRSSATGEPRARAALPRIELPRFSGQYTEWPAFRDLFKALVIEENNLTDIERLQYLLTQLSGEAAELLSGTALIGSNFHSAWEQLVQRYDNRRLLVSAQLHKLLSLAPMNGHSASELKRVLHAACSVVNAVAALERPLSKDNDLLVLLVVQKLDAATRREWEQIPRSSTAFPTFEEVREFLSARIQGEEAIEADAGQQSKPQTSSKSAKNAKVHHTGTKAAKGRCPLCKGDHSLMFCSTFRARTPEERLQTVQSLKRCANCLGAHLLTDCSSAKRCQQGSGRHHTMVHGANLQDVASTSMAPTSHASCLLANGTSSILLATALVGVKDADGVFVTSRALIDPCSEVSLISESLAQRLRLERKQGSLPVVGVGVGAPSSTRGRVTATIASLRNEFTCVVEALVLPKLTSYRPRSSKLPATHGYLRDLPLADPHYWGSRSIDLLLGADIFSTLLLQGVRKGPVGAPVAQETQLGWILSGVAVTGSQESDQTRTSPPASLQCSVDMSLLSSLQRFWEQEEISESPRPMSPEERMCEEHFLASHSRRPDGRYVVRLPTRAGIEQLGSSYNAANRALMTLERRFVKNPTLHRHYQEFLQVYETLGHMVPVSPASSQGGRQCFHLPHHGVVKEVGEHTKLRVVFNGSQRTDQGRSLNDQLLVGPNLLPDLADVLLRWRMFRYVFAADIEMMYRQIEVHPEDRDLQRILWRPIVDGEVREYQLTTVTYGLACAPFLALRTMQQLAEDESARFPKAAIALRWHIYMDDLLCGANTIEEAKELQSELSGLCMAGGMPLRKWTANHAELLSHLPEEWLKGVSGMEWSASEDATRMLGLSWQPRQDEFCFDFSHVPSQPQTSKRGVLSQLAQFFDPLGWLAPVTVKGKIFLQSLWLLKTGWDAPLPQEYYMRWRDYYGNLSCLGELRIPRHVGSFSEGQRELHVFADASERAYGCCVYMRSLCTETGVTVRLLMAKTKVAPLKQVSLPRLELSAAYLAARLLAHLRKALALPDSPAHCWTDSTVTLGWLQGHPSRWTTFVANRVAEIQRLVPDAKWHHVKSAVNPADCASRGLSPGDLLRHSLWWTGPPFLCCHAEGWPSSDASQWTHVDQEVRRRPVVLHVTRTALSELLDRCSSLFRLLRVTAWCLRAGRRRKSEVQREPHYREVLHPEEIKGALHRWVVVIQGEEFREEQRALRNELPLPTRSSLLRLDPFLDSEGVLRVGGRLKHAALEFEEKHPALLPRASRFTELVVESCHRRTLHGGAQLTLTTLRRRFWVPQGRQLVKTIIQRCVTCARWKGAHYQQKMGNLPSLRVTPARPFLHAGVDYAGPYSIRVSKGRGCKSYKGYIAVFKCFSTLAVHLEAVSDYSTQAFLAAYRRFAARRGVCSSLTSDCGTNFVGASTELRQLFDSAKADTKVIAASLANDGTEWRFIPPGAPHFGGLWESAVRACKHHLRRVIADATLTFEEMATLLAQVEACINSRPLQAVTDDPTDLTALTPAHFLVYQPLVTIPEPTLEHVRPSLLSRWQLLRKMLVHFWQRWSEEYLPELQARTKWLRSEPNPQVGDLCLIKHEHLPPSKWALARITALHPGSDGLVRVATLRTAGAELKRPLTKLCPLPTASSTMQVEDITGSAADDLS